MCVCLSVNRLILKKADIILINQSRLKLVGQEEEIRKVRYK
jgi:hypothetical protein